MVSITCVLDQLAPRHAGNRAVREVALVRLDPSVAHGVIGEPRLGDGAVVAPRHAATEWPLLCVDT